MVNESAILAARRGLKEITPEVMDDAIEKVHLGPERNSRVISDHEKQVVAYHESGHALIGQLIESADPIQKVTIIPRGMAGGVTWFLPEDDRIFEDEDYLKGHLAIALGGRVAEEIVFDEITTGASGDLQSVTDVARSMVTRFGMSEKLGPVTYGEKEELVFLGRELGEQRNYSDNTAKEIDNEVKRLVHEAHALVTELLIQNRPKLDEIAYRLMEEETIDAADFLAMFEEDYDFDFKAQTGILISKPEHSL